MNTRNRCATAPLLLLVGALLVPAIASADDTLPPPTVHTKPPFDPKIDGLAFRNSGDFRSPDGNCFGMSLIAITNFFARRARGEDPSTPHPTHKPATTKTPAANVHEEELVSYLQEHVGQDPMHESHLDHPKNILDGLERIDETGDPEIFTITGSEGGHACVLFGYEDGCALILDPNHPHETIRWPFDFKKGFGKHPLAKGKNFYGVLRTAGSTPFSRFKASKEIELLSDPDEMSKRSLRRYPKQALEITPAHGDDPAVIAGKVKGGPKKDEDGAKSETPNRAWLRVDGKPIAHANVKADGTFKLKVPADAITGDTKTVDVVLTVDSDDTDASGKLVHWQMFSGVAGVDLKELGARKGLLEPLGAVTHE